MTTRCLIADDQAMVREGFAAVLDSQPGLLVVGQAADGADAVRQARQLQPHVVLMDVRMPVMDGLQATRQILSTAADPARPRVLMLTTFDLDDYVYAALRAGASGFLLKDATAAELIHAVRVVAAGEALLAPSVTRRLIADFARQPRPAPPFPAAPGALTPRETEVLRLIAHGLSNSRDQQHPGHRRTDHQDPRRPHPGQTRPPRPRPGRRPRLRKRPRRARRIRPSANKTQHQARSVIAGHQEAGRTRRGAQNAQIGTIPIRTGIWSVPRLPTRAGLSRRRRSPGWPLQRRTSDWTGCTRRGCRRRSRPPGGER